MVVGGCAGEHSDAVHSVFNDLKALAAGAEEDTRGQVAVGFSRHPEPKNAHSGRAKRYLGYVIVKCNETATAGIHFDLTADIRVGSSRKSDYPIG